MPEQIPLFKPLQEGISFVNFWPGENSKLIELLKEQVLNPTQPCIYLWGKSGAGKSHLLQAACGYANQQHKTAVYIPLADTHHLDPDIFQGMENYSLICVDDLDAIAGVDSWESALFHLYNRAREHGALLMYGATKKPADMTITLQDLASRLAWGIVWQVRELSDGGKLAALQQRAHQRGFLLPDEVGIYLMQRWPRDMHSLFELLDKLDQVSLSEKRKLTIPFIRQFL